MREEDKGEKSAGGKEMSRRNRRVRKREKEGNKKQRKRMREKRNVNIFPHLLI